MESSQQALARAYRAILSDLPCHWLDRSRIEDPEFSKLSGLFLPGTSEAYLNARTRIMVVGRETRRWDVIKTDKPYVNLDSYIERAMSIQQAHLKNYISAPMDKGASFFNFLRALADDHGHDGIAWTNLFSFAWNKKSPMQWVHFSKLLEVSEKLLKAQIEILKPDVIIFANGASSAKYRQLYFPYKGESSVCSRQADYREEGIHNGQLWRFHLHDSIPCFRIQHPSSISVGARAARKRLLEELRTQAARLTKPEVAQITL